MIPEKESPPKIQEMRERAKHFLTDRMRCHTKAAAYSYLPGRPIDAVGFRKSGDSYIVLCLPDRLEFQKVMEIIRLRKDYEVGVHRFMMVPESADWIDEVPNDWGVLRYFGNSVRVYRPATPYKRTERAENALLLSMVKMYAAGTGKDPDQFKAAMKSESAQEAATEPPLSAPPKPNSKKIKKNK